ncbi:MAG TPA: hypothetical protein VJR02_21175 [Pyrinomonadaceae bacterium]|nr:hypothetical protein [Pyrinomonadaceae bacterium]
MAQNVNLDTVRAAALARIDRSQRNFRLAFIGAFVVESLFLGTFLLLADFSNKVHMLLLISTVSCYTIVVLGLVALGAHINHGIARVLKAVELFPNN